MATKWHINGDYILACNCDYGCPCNFNARPTAGFCQGATGFLVAEGAYGDVRLDGQKTGEGGDTRIAHYVHRSRQNKADAGEPVEQRGEIH